MFHLLCENYEWSEAIEELRDIYDGVPSDLPRGTLSNQCTKAIFC